MDHSYPRDHLTIFISYARKDGTPHAKRFFDELSRSPRYSVTYDRRFRLGEGFDRSIEAAISSADVMIVVLTDAVFEKEWARREILYAKKLNRKKKRIDLIVAQMTDDPDVPISIVDLPPLEFAKDASTAWAGLYAELERASSPANGARPFDGADGPHSERYAAAAREASERAEAERRRAEDLPGAEERLQQRVREGWDRKHSAGGSVRTQAALIFVNEMPELPEITFQDRVPKMTEVDEALRTTAIRLVLITGDAGTGKTAFLREYRRRLAEGDVDAPAAAGFVYIAVRGYRQVSAAALLNDLANVAPAAGDLQRTLRRNLPWWDGLDAVLEALGDTPVVVAIDDAEDLLDDRGAIQDRELRAVLSELIGRPGHRIRFLMVVKERRSHPMLVAHPRHVAVCDLAKGLPSDHTIPFIQALDSAGTVAVGDLPEPDLRRLGVISDGNPRFLELTYCLLRSDPDVTLAEMFDEIGARNDDSTREPFPLLIDAVLSRLDRTDRRVVQALSVYRHPVRPEAVDYLLEAYVPGIDSAPILETLAKRQLVRRDGDRYFLPPTPDADCVIDSVPVGKDDDWRSIQPVFTRLFLRRRAADFYAEVKSREPVHGPDDLQPHLHEIELRIAAGDLAVAVELMEAVDDEHLTKWGQSGVLIHWREMIDDKIEKGTRPRAANLSYLISALSGEEDHTGRWAAHLTEVLTEPWIRQFPDDRIRFGIQLADIQKDNGDLDAAAAQYRECARRCRSKSMRYEAVVARASLGVCLARQGKFDEARQEFDFARTWAPKLTGDKHDEAGALLGLNEGWALGQLGEVRAMAVLEEGLAVATRSKDVLLTGRLLDGLAALYCDNKQVDDALSPALEAAKIAMRTGHPGLSRNANVTLALTYLLADDLANAAAAIHTAAQQPVGILALPTQAVKGVIHFRMEDMPKAITAFHAACTEAWLRLERAPQEYAVYDAVGLALTGLELCGEARRLPRALDMYGRARSIAPVKGALRRAKAQLALMEPKADKTKLEAAQRAADGDDAGARQLIA
jgi:hypothetical protein